MNSSFDHFISWVNFDLEYLTSHDDLQPDNASDLHRNSILNVYLLDFN